MSHSAANPVAVFFDLDGTLVDPAGGITGGIAHALEANGLAVPEESVLSSLVGPPLSMGLRSIAGVPEGQVPAVIESYRGWYETHGMAQSTVYPGIPEVLDALAASGVRVAVTTAKPQALAVRLLSLHGLAARFEAIVGTSNNELEAHAASGSKEALVRSACQLLSVEASRSAVVGDRHFDILAAVATGARAIGAGWGFAVGDELLEAGADVVVDSPWHLAHTLLKEDAA
ncbi:HAD hydrolase-like protein [Galactobacter caseinivorans]|uniref:HAD hydrolase-like protein n=1 Tax=Galactobacter caseinivorans TaxID=2676123 RepID=UPI001314BB4B|nr:HAD hydrolase-like protein [Galactobacter caseinivorans]